jgi:lipoprotein Spr
MYNTSKKKFAKSIVGVSLSLSLLFSGSMLMTAKPAQAATVSASATASNIISTGKQYLGVRYQFGARTGNTSSFDCSSFTQFAFKQNGVNIPRSSKQQSQAGTFVPRNQLQPGDLVFFYQPIHHVAIYMGNGKLLHTFGKQGVTITDLNSGWWNNHYTTARRVLPTFGQDLPTTSSPKPVKSSVSKFVPSAPTFTSTPTAHRAHSHVHNQSNNNEEN